MFADKKILLVEAHPDDVVWGCGGTLAKLRPSNSFKAICFTTCLEDPSNKGILEENRNALKLLGVDDNQNFNLPRRNLYLEAQKIRDLLYHVKESWSPDVVFCTSMSDVHPDHSTVGMCCQTIFRDSASIMAFSILRSLGNGFKPSCFIKLSTREFKLKLQALRFFRSQYRRSYFRKKVVEADAIYYGSQINADFAEAFEVVGLIM